MYGFKLNTGMDKLRRRSYTESLKTTLNCYQLSSADSLSGPSGYSALAAQLWCKENQQSPPNPPPPLIQIPLLMPNDTSTQTAEVLLGGERISCFIVGGEKRLCLPQILTTVLRDFSISEINRTCAELHIYCSRCSPDQLDILKVLKILPFNTTQCGLITKSDAERLVSALGVEYHLNAKSDPNNYHGKSKGIKVYHECFGMGYGHFYPDLYTSPGATCIACMDCRITFSPSRFVSHSHRGLEKRTCHWGFDPENWRNYLLLPEDIEGQQRKELEKQLNALKAKFDPSSPNSDFFSRTSPTLKRRLDPESKLEHGKKIKEDKTDSRELPPSTGVPSMCLGYPLALPPSAFKPFNGEPTLSLRTLAELRAVQEEAFLKALAPMVHDRRLLPGYLQFGPPAVIPSQASTSDWSTVVREAPLTPNITLAPVEQQKRTASYVLEQERKREAARERSNSSGSSGGRVHRRKTPPMKTEVPESLNMFRPERHRPVSPASMHSRRSSEEAAYHQSRKYVATSERSSDGPICLKKSFLKSRFRRQSSSEAQELPQNLSNGHRRSRSPDKENEIVDVISDDPPPLVKIRSSEENKNTPPLVAMSNAVAAASAMLELSSSVNDTRRSRHISSSPPPNINSSPSQKTNLHYKSSSEGNGSSHHHHSTYPIVYSVDQKHCKWTFPSASYIISSSGSQELRTFQTLLEELQEERIKLRFLQEVVKMKSRSEEDVDTRMRLQRDTERELERVKASRRQCLEEAAKERQESRREIERLRKDHMGHVKETDETLVELGRQLADLRLHPNSHEWELLQHKVLDQLRKQIDEKGEATRMLEKQLREEMDRRIGAERRLEEESRGRASFLRAREDEAVMRDLRRSDVKVSEKMFSSSERNHKPIVPPPAQQSITDLSTTPHKNVSNSHYSSPKARDASPA